MEPNHRLRQKKKRKVYIENKTTRIGRIENLLCKRPLQEVGGGGKKGTYWHGLGRKKGSVKRKNHLILNTLKITREGKRKITIQLRKPTRGGYNNNQPSY